MSTSEVVRFQSEHHPLAFTGSFYSNEEYISHLVHMKAYEVATALAKGLTVLDLGCNNGYGTVEIGRGAKRIVGLDVSASALDSARRLHASTNVEFLHFEGDTIPFDARSFDLVVSFQVIEHIENPRPYLQEIHRVLKTEGIALFTTPNAAIRLDPGMKPWNPFHVREFTCAQFGDVLREVFDNVEVRGLFATDEVYNMEFMRCQSALANARERSKSSYVPPAKVPNGRARTFIKSALPRPVVEIIRRALSMGSPQTKPLPAGVLEKYSTRDFYYQNDRIDRALDLMAVCSKSPLTRPLSS